MLRMLAIVCILNFVAPAAAVAQTAEETVLFIMKGWEDGAQLLEKQVTIRAIGNNRWGAAPFGHQNETPMPSIQVSKIRECVYAIRDGSIVESYNFKALTTYRILSAAEARSSLPWPNKFAIDAHGKDFYERGTLVQDDYFYPTSADRNRLLAAFVYFRSKFCAGRAF